MSFGATSDFNTLLESMTQVLANNMGCCLIFEMKTGTQNISWFKKARVWLAVKKLERQLRNSRYFQKECQKLGCPTLAELEGSYQEILVQEIHHQQQALQKHPLPAVRPNTRRI